MFLDADVRLAHGAIRAVVGARRTQGGVLSVQPFHQAPTAIEELSALFNVVSLMGVGAATDRPHGLFGPVIACARRDYDAVGGHAAVRSAVIEDVALSRVFADARIPFAVRTGGRLVSFRMYPLGLRSMIEGWSKNMALGASAVPVWRTLGVAWWISTLVSTAVVPVTLWSRPAVPAALLYLAVVVTLRAVLRQVGSFRWWVAAAFPIATAFFVVVFLRSLWCTHVRHAVTWRGRTIDVREAL